MKRIGLLVLALSAGCASSKPTKPAWVGAGGPYRSGEHQYQLTLPAEWMRLNDDRILLATRDGTAVQLVVVHRDPVDKPLQHTNRQARKDMSPLELSEVIADEFLSNPRMKGVEVLERAPATVADGPGFRMLSAFKSDSGLRKKNLVYGRLEGSWFYWLLYEAPERYYFEANLAAFEDVVKSFHIAG